MVNIILVCAMGMSTSLMVNKMKNAAKTMNVDVNIVAMSSDEFFEEPVKTDALLIAPQISFRTDEIKEAFGGKIAVIDVISQMEYGMMKGDLVLKRVLEKLEK